MISPATGLHEGASHMAKLASSVDALAAGLPDSDPHRAALRTRAATLGQECGCAMSGTFLVTAAALVAGYFASMGSLNLVSGLSAVGFVFVASLAGKLAGLAVARLRLLTLRRKILRRLSGNEVRHVHVH